ncbi:adenosine kinase [Telmatospirillum sp. J64-1]|uniref:adenosine kinase n=1 Tax=Telmatospirillum sp. J64-1 TaxID=2502183 RepID=UPI00115CA61C|nr:adenosine kinase [Telmatospirillum sp. J64-1]
MTETRFHVTGIGNAIVDVLSHADDALLAELGLDKGIMTLVDSEQAQKIYSRMGPAIECSGGSAANTIAGIASLGGKAAYIGKVADDQLGEVFRHDIRAAGVTFETSPGGDGAPTARCLILVTPDAQRTMQTFLGACVELGPEDIDEELVAASSVTYLEGYLWDPPQAKEAFLKAARVSHDAGRMVSLSLSDPFCVDRHRDSFLELVNEHVDILFANEAELKALYRTDDFDAALRLVRGHAQVTAVTRGEKGSVIIAGDDVHVVSAEHVPAIIDTTGAGDLYAAGFLYGYTHGRALPECGRLGGIAAAEIISHFGARPETDLIELISAKV